MWSPFSAKPLFSPQEWEATEELYRNERVLGKTLLFFLTFSVFSLPHKPHLSHSAFFPPSLRLSSFLRVRELSEWLILRPWSSARGGKVLSYQSCQAFSVCSMNPACIVSCWCEYADVVVWDRMSAVSQYTMRAYICLCLRWLVLY